MVRYSASRGIRVVQNARVRVRGAGEGRRCGWLRIPPRGDHDSRRHLYVGHLWFQVTDRKRRRRSEPKASRHLTSGRAACQRAERWRGARHRRRRLRWLGRQSDAGRDVRGTDKRIASCVNPDICRRGIPVPGSDGGSPGHSDPDDTSGFDSTGDVPGIHAAGDPGLDPAGDPGFDPAGDTSGRGHRPGDEYADVDARDNTSGHGHHDDPRGDASGRHAPGDEHAVGLDRFHARRA